MSSDDSGAPEQQEHDEEHDEQEEQQQEAAPAKGKAAKGKAPQLPAYSSKKLRRLQEQHERRGIVYISRIPPHLKPQKLRQMLEQYAEIGRIYLAPEDPALRRKRKQAGGNSGRNFTEGWVEFEDKGKAKEVVAMLNGQQMGGKRRSAYYYDLWSLKYLPKFKWDHLTEEVNYQKAVREQRLAAEVSAAKRERDFYLSRVDKAKGVSAMLERKRKRQGDEEQQQQGGGGGGGQQQQQQQGEGGTPPAKKAGKQGKAEQQQQKQGQAAVAAGGSGGAPDGVKVLRSYGQRRAKADPVTDAAAPKLSSSLLRLIAGKQKGGGGSGGAD